MKKRINWVISKIKGEAYQVDKTIDTWDIIKISFSRVFMLIRGHLSFTQNKGKLFVGKRVEMKHKNLIRMGKGVIIADDCLLDALSLHGINFGDNVSMGKRTVIECSGSLKNLGVGINVGNNVGLGRDCFYGCAGGIEIGEDTIIGNYVSFHSENHNYERSDLPIRLQGVNHKGIKIGKDCWVGAKATILDGAIIEDGCIIAAGAVISAGIYKSKGIYGGIPAKLLKMRN